MVNPIGSSPLFQPKAVQSDELTDAQQLQIAAITTHILQGNPSAALSLIQNLLNGSPPLPPAYKNEVTIAVEILKSAQGMWGQDPSFAHFGYDIASSLISNYPLSNTPPNLPPSILNTANRALLNNPPDWQGFSDALSNISANSLPEGYSNLMQLCQQHGGNLGDEITPSEQVTAVGWFNRIVQVLNGSGLPPA